MTSETMADPSAAAVRLAVKKLVMATIPQIDVSTICALAACTSLFR